MGDGVTSPSPYEVHVLAIHSDGTFSVVDVGSLYDRLGEYEETLDEAINNTAIDDWRANLDDHPLEHIRRIIALNATGDANAYWEDH